MVQPWEHTCRTDGLSSIPSTTKGRENKKKRRRSGREENKEEREKGKGGAIRKKPEKIGFGKRPRFKWPLWVCVDSTRQQSPYERQPLSKGRPGPVAGHSQMPRVQTQQYYPHVSDMVQVTWD